MYFSVSSSSYACSSTKTVAQSHIQPMKLVLQASAAPDAKPAFARQNKEVRNSAGQLVKSCLSSRSSVAQRPNTHQRPGMPRFVHFNAELEQARWFFKTDAPQCASRDAITCNDSHHLKHTNAVFTRSSVTLTPIRGPSPSFLSFEESPVVLETVRYADKMLTGTIKVHNLAFEKYVAVRLTNDGWKSVEDVQASFLRAVTGADGCRPGVDRFRFSAPIADTPSTTDGAITISMCVRYRVNSEEHWDNNKGANYEFKLAVCSTSKSNAAVPIVVDDPGLISLATTASILAHGRHTSSNTFKRAYMLPSFSPNRVSAADTRRYMHYSETKFSTSATNPHKRGPDHSSNPGAGEPRQAAPDTKSLPIFSTTEWSSNNGIFLPFSITDIYCGTNPNIGFSSHHKSGLTAHDRSSFVRPTVWMSCPRSPLLHC